MNIPKEYEGVYLYRRNEQQPNTITRTLNAEQYNEVYPLARLFFIGLYKKYKRIQSYHVPYDEKLLKIKDISPSSDGLYGISIRYGTKSYERFYFNHDMNWYSEDGQPIIEGKFNELIHMITENYFRNGF